MVCRWFNTATQLASFFMKTWASSLREYNGISQKWRLVIGGDPRECQGPQWEKLVTVLSWERNPRVLSDPDYHDKGPLRRKRKKTVDQCGFYYAFSPHILNISYKKNILERTRPKPSINFGQRGKRCRSIWRKTQYLVLKAAVNYNWQHITNYYYIVTRWQYRPRSDWQTRLWSRLSHSN